jgi:hypothetical protein
VNREYVLFAGGVAMFKVKCCGCHGGVKGKEKGYEDEGEDQAYNE